MVIPAYNVTIDFFLLDNYADYFCKMSLQLIKSLIDKNITLKNANENNVT